MKCWPCIGYKGSVIFNFRAKLCGHQRHTFYTASSQGFRVDQAAGSKPRPPQQSCSDAWWMPPVRSSLASLNGNNITHFSFLSRGCKVCDDNFLILTVQWFIGESFVTLLFRDQNYRFCKVESMWGWRPLCRCMGKHFIHYVILACPLPSLLLDSRFWSKLNFVNQKLVI